MRMSDWSSDVCSSDLETLQLTREEYRYARNWKAAHLLEVGSHDNGLGLPKGDYHIERVFENGRVQLRDMRGRKHRVEPSKIDPNGKLNRQYGRAAGRERVGQ